VGRRFDKKRWQETLKRGHVDSITLFSKCHHGWSYHPTKVGKIHPELDFDLLRAQYDATKEIGVNAPVYLSAGVDNYASEIHPEWREVGPDGKYTGWAKSPIEAGFHKMDFLSPYLDFLCDQIVEAVRLFPDCDGIFLDIISQGQACGKWALALMEEEGLDAENEEDRKTCARLALQRYYEKTTAAARIDNPQMPIFHNSGHISVGQRELYETFFSHLELESLPTGGWGYDHFPMSVKYTENLPHDVLGMTGKFHTTWGEFGGFKHPNALRYECAVMVAFGSKCSVGDQLHPEGELDESTYDLIGAAYSEVEAKEPWLRGAVNVPDIGLLASSSFAKIDSHERDNPADVGAGRMLLEEKFLFTVYDDTMDWLGCKLLILPDDIAVTPELKIKLDAYLAGGGKLLLTGSSGLYADGSGPAFESGAAWEGVSPFQPDYILPESWLRPDFVNSPQVMYLPSQRIRVTTGESLGAVYDPYFNRNFKHFCSHQHAPNRPEPSGYDMGVTQGAITWLAHPIFTLYRGYGTVAYRHIVGKLIRKILGSGVSLESSLPSTGRANLMFQREPNRHVLHLLYGNTINRGGPLKMSGGNVRNVSSSIEVIEDLIPLSHVQVGVRLPATVKRVTLEPQGSELSFEERDGRIHFSVPEILCHQMIVLHHE
jgi:hypothetical protein